ncbi:hypothetical protein [Vulcanisaeta distributa]|uniref:hypothetical protein n=1 Tax=Vulcanisaeta distributa TaxID=164451 RepID=UPI0006D179CC|nr:hypothetical protein [Vulcanisaeta distributa]
MRLVKSTWIADANISAELIKKNYFCHGKRSGFKYQCGDEIYDLETINESINLLMESLKRIQRWNVWETWWIDKHKQELLRIRENVKMFRKKYGKSIDKLIKLIDEIINYIDKFQRYWIEKDISYEIKNLVDSLINGKSKVIVRKTSNSLIVSVRSNHITLTIIKLKRRGLIVELTLNGFNGKTMVIPDIFKRLMSKKEYEGFVKELLKALRGGFAETDEGVDKGKLE